jgi:hypothetical protein
MIKLYTVRVEYTNSKFELQAAMQWVTGQHDSGRRGHDALICAIYRGGRYPYSFPTWFKVGENTSPVHSTGLWHLLSIEKPQKNDDVRQADESR